MLELEKRSFMGDKKQPILAIKYSTLSWKTRPPPQFPNNHERSHAQLKYAFVAYCNTLISCHHLTDVDDFCSSFADAMDTEKAQSLSVEDELEESIRSTEHLTLCQLLIVRNANLQLRLQLTIEHRHQQSMTNHRHASAILLDSDKLENASLPRKNSTSR